MNFVWFYSKKNHFQSIYEFWTRILMIFSLKMEQFIKLFHLTISEPSFGWLHQALTNSIFSGYGGYGGYGVSKVVTPAVASVAAPIYGGYGSYGGYGGYGVSKVVSPVATLGMHVWYTFFPFTHSSNNSRNSNYYSSLQVISRTYSCVFCIVQFIARVHRISKNASKFYSAKEINKKKVWVRMF